MFARIVYFIRALRAGYGVRRGWLIAHAAAAVEKNTRDLAAAWKGDSGALNALHGRIVQFAEQELQRAREREDAARDFWREHGRALTAAAVVVVVVVVILALTVRGVL